MNRLFCIAFTSVALLLALSCAGPRRQVVAPAAPAPPRGPPVPVLEVQAPPADRVVKLRGRRVVLKSGRLLSDLTKEPHRPRVPEPWIKEGRVHRGTYKVCVAIDGRVRSVSTLKSAGNGSLDAAFRDAIQTWRYQPTRLGLKRVPICYGLGLKVRYVRRP